MLIVFGMIGLALGAFEWSALSTFVSLRTAAIGFVVDHGPAWLLADNAPWWLLTNYPEAHDVFTWLDGALIAGWIIATALVVGGFVFACLAVAARPLAGPVLRNAYALAYTLAPLAGAGLFVGLSSLPATLAHGEGLHLSWLPMARAVLLALGASWSVYLAYRWLDARAITRRVRVLAPMTVAACGVLAAWWPFVFRGF
jgi:hypothetical protein